MARRKLPPKLPLVRYCPYCGEKGQLLIFAHTRRRKLSYGTFACPNCLLGFEVLNPREGIVDKTDEIIEGLREARARKAKKGKKG